jgi:hypothetical protein
MVAQAGGRLELTNFRDWILAGMLWIKEGPAGPEMHFNLPMYAQFREITEDQAEIEIAEICREVLQTEIETEVRYDMEPQGDV